MKYLIFISTILFSNLIYSQNYNSEYNDPVIVLYETDPWLMVIGSDVPVFALYQNGQIIYRKIVDNEYKYFEIKNDRDKTQQIIKSFGITDGLVKGEDYFKISSSTDQPTNILLLNFKEFKEIKVYGDLKNKESREKAPKDFLIVSENINKFEDKNAKEWLPEQIEVLATDYSHSPETPIKWNNEWTKSIVDRGESLISVYLDKKYFEDFKSLIKNLKPKQAVEINGKKYSLSYRLPFPNLN